MFLSPFKKVNKIKKRSIIELKNPPRKELEDQLLKTISSSKKDPKKLPIILWMKYNRNLDLHWLRIILDQGFDPELELSSLSLIYCFCLGQKDGYLERGLGKPGQQEQLVAKVVEYVCIKFRQQLEKYHRLVELNIQSRLSINIGTINTLAASIKACIAYDWDKKTICPLQTFLVEQNAISGSGWLFILLCQHDRMNILKPNHESLYLIVILFSIIKGFCKSEVDLCTALGKKGSIDANRKRLKKDSADIITSILRKNSTNIPRKVLSPSASNHTAPTASTTENGLAQESSSPAAFPEVVFFSVDDNDNGASPISSPSNTSSMFASPLPQSRNRRTSFISPTASTPAPTPLSSASSVLATQVKKKVCFQPTPGRTERQLFSSDTDLVSSECSHLIKTLQDATNDGDIERLVIDFVSRRADCDGVLCNKKITDSKNLRLLQDETTTRSRKKWIHLKTHSVMEYIRTNIPGAADDPDIVKHILTKTIENNFESVVCEKDDVDGKITAIEMTEVRNRAGWKMPSSAVAQIVKDIVHLLRLKNKLRVDKSPFEGRLRKKLGQLERDGSIPSTFEYVTCFITKDDTGKCIYYYIPNVPLLIERLVAGCLLEGEYEDSIDISFLKGKIIIRFGCDRGGGDLIMAISLANRRRGNSGRYSIPIGVVERATEIYSNLKKTVYSEARKAVLEQLVNQHLFMVRLLFYEEDGSTLREVKCILLRFTGIERKELSKTNFICTLGEHVLNDGTGVEWKSKACGRSVVDQALINTDMFYGLHDDENQQNTFFGSNNNNSNCNCNCRGNSQLNLTVKLVKSEGMYVGCKIIATKTTEEIFSFEFDNGVNTTETDSTNISIDCLQLIGVPCEDGKMVCNVTGISTAGSSYPCPKCLWGLKDKTLPKWVEDFGTTIDQTLQYKDYEQRTGANSRQSCNDTFIKRRTKRTDAVTLQLKKDVFSVVHTPLLHVDDDLLYIHTGEPMHVSQGCNTHLTEECCTQLEEIFSLDSMGDFIPELMTKVKSYIDEMVDLEESNEYKNAQKLFKREEKKVNAAFTKTINDPDNTRLYDEYEQAISKRNKCGESSESIFGYLDMMNMINGGKELTMVLDNFVKSKKKKFNKAIYLFMKAIKTFAGDFNKQHGVYELTNSRGIQALESREEIYDMVVNGCNNIGVTTIMNWWLACANLLYEISLILKSQDKISVEGIQKLKHLISDYVRLWKKQLETYDSKNWCYWKLHMLCDGIVEFAEKTGMTGRCSAEGLENKHYVMNQLKKLMAPIALDKVRCEKLMQRQQSCLIPGIADVHKLFERADETAKTGARGPYASRGTRTKLLEDLPLQDTVEEEAEDGYFLSTLGNIIPNDLSEIYHYMRLGKAPDEWAQTFLESTLLGNKVSTANSFLPV
ncbi:hypothetical protein FRACYDRAFT_235067 [Fragilariopsis cylindrus CCMP1102]|uniref:Uncharacterized protein n=1 Tax=Fragilariopsis cylindrus CCMP1102 TaxID=635003 RepID=A0A1E7FTD8_9STRA|nr:hypothetical protein FRACYDRAFT_235067 [Fragilariopsis cylindrus CCMP1102]|eukprot:OEU21441.1 hypothetical protein FRACYDRAFT_235067 [Fragilariopsis cylindrus CCMP1102]